MSVEVVSERPMTLSRIIGINAFVFFGDRFREGSDDFGRMEKVCERMKRREARMSCVSRKNNGTDVVLSTHLFAKMSDSAASM